MTQGSNTWKTAARFFTVYVLVSATAFVLQRTGVTELGKAEVSATWLSGSVAILIAIGVACLARRREHVLVVLSLVAIPAVFGLAFALKKILLMI